MAEDAVSGEMIWRDVVQLGDSGGIIFNWLHVSPSYRQLLLLCYYALTRRYSYMTCHRGTMPTCPGHDGLSSYEIQIPQRKRRPLPLYRLFTCRSALPRRS